MDDANAPATKQDGAQLQSEMQQLHSEMHIGFAQLRSEMQQQSNDLKNAFRDSQTEILRVIYSFASSVDTRFKEAELSDMMLRQRLSAVESRLLEVEKRLNLPPAA